MLDLSKDINLFQGDCLEVMKGIPDGSVDLILTDMPYNTTSCKWDTKVNLDAFWEEVKRIRKPNSATVATGSQPFTSVLGFSNIKELKYSWQWVKSRATGHLNAKKMPMKNLEDVLVFYKKPPTYNPQGVVECDIQQHNSKSHSLRGKITDPTSTVTGGIEFKPYIQKLTNYPKQLIEVPSEGSTVHPTQKPVELMEYLISTYSNTGETVVDMFMGSGTTGVACKNLNRKFIGIELDETYFNIAKERIGNT